MSTVAPPAEPGQVDYPESDGEPMADNTRQFVWITVLFGNLAAWFRDVADVFVCGNQFWYPVEGHPEIVNAPDVSVVFGRPKGHRPSWKQWEEGDVPMTVVFEVLPCQPAAGNLVRPLRAGDGRLPARRQAIRFLRGSQDRAGGGRGAGRPGRAATGAAGGTEPAGPEGASQPGRVVGVGTPRRGAPAARDLSGGWAERDEAWRASVSSALGSAVRTTAASAG